MMLAQILEVFYFDVSYEILLGYLTLCIETKVGKTNNVRKIKINIWAFGVNTQNKTNFLFM
jgi:hypothetical protein